MRFCLFAAGLVLLTAGSQATVVTHPAPEGEILSSQYAVEVDGKTVPVYTARVLDPPFAGKEYDYGGPYSFAGFDTSGRVQVRIHSEKTLTNLVLRPTRPNVKIQVPDPHTLLLSLPGPCKLSVEPDGKNSPLLLFASAPEQNRPAPKPDKPHLLYFGPGIHRPGKITLTNDQTLYIAGGAVVKGGIEAQGNNITIRGRGILDGSDWPWREGPTGNTISICGTNVTVSGITIRGSSHWTIVPRNSRQVIINDVKICGSRVQNDDGINPCNSQVVRISDCFIRSDDDCVALKGLDLNAPDNNVEDITVENCILWCDRARIFLLGHESRAAFMRNVRLRNLDIIHFSMTAFLFEPGEEMRLEDLLVENIRVHGEGQRELIRLKPVVNQYMRNKVPGHIGNVRFRNVTVEGKAGEYKVQLIGADADHAVRSVSFENLTVNAGELKADSGRLEVGKFVEPPQLR